MSFLAKTNQSDRPRNMNQLISPSTQTSIIGNWQLTAKDAYYRSKPSRPPTEEEKAEADSKGKKYQIKRK